jgi:hypothetical protein
MTGTNMRVATTGVAVTPGFVRFAGGYLLPDKQHYAIAGAANRCTVISMDYAAGTGGGTVAEFMDAC